MNQQRIDAESHVTEPPQDAADGPLTVNVTQATDEMAEGTPGGNTTAPASKKLKE